LIQIYLKDILGTLLQLPHIFITNWQGVSCIRPTKLHYEAPRLYVDGPVSDSFTEVEQCHP